jgi:NADPH-dependent glutamate synthase beta subunit-like oxidoreductase/coenzyme F420-reducing hydrogenase delta subunit/Pyruvate/2-oxoacid:ferredoxin oxidoreductase delta subunit
LDPEKARQQIIKIGDEIYEGNPLFTICGYICGLCERDCNFKDFTGAIRRRMLKRFISDYYVPYLDTKLALPAPKGEKVAVVGGGPGGLMCAYMLSQKGYRVTILERNPELGGALRYIPSYRLPTKVIDGTLNNLVRIAHIKADFGVKMGDGGKTLDGLMKEGYKAIFVATGTPNPRPLTFEMKPVAGGDLEGVIFGLNLLYDANQRNVSPHLFDGKRVIVVGGGNVAFDVARTARRLGGDVSLVCLECEDKSCRDGIPADVEEIEGATDEGIKITYSRGVNEIIGKDGKFAKIRCPRCTCVFDEKGFNPKFDKSDDTYLEGDVLLVTIGQGMERAFFQQEGLLNEQGRIDVDPTTLMSNLKKGVFIGGDVRRIGFAAEAMREGGEAAESIDRYIRGGNLKSGRVKEYKKATTPKSDHYKPQPELAWLPVEERLNFGLFEKGFTLEEAVAEARRCLCCGPCRSCKACISLGLRPSVAKINVDENLCIRCGNCVYLCPYEAPTLVSPGLVKIDLDKCHGCGICAAMCPAFALDIENWERERISALISQLAAEMASPKVLVFRCQWTALPPLDGDFTKNARVIDLPCAAKVETYHILEALQQGVDGVLVAACPEEDCKRGRGSRQAKHSVTALQEKLKQMGYGDRIHFCTVKPRHPEIFNQELAQFIEKISTILVKGK